MFGSIAEDGSLGRPGIPTTCILDSSIGIPKSNTPPSQMTRRSAKQILVACAILNRPLHYHGHYEAMRQL